MYPIRKSGYLEGYYSKSRSPRGERQVFRLIGRRMGGDEIRTGREKQRVTVYKYYTEGTKQTVNIGEIDTSTRSTEAITASSRTRQMEKFKARVCCLATNSGRDTLPHDGGRQFFAVTGYLILRSTFSNTGTTCVTRVSPSCLHAELTTHAITIHPTTEVQDHLEGRSSRS